MPRSVLLLSGFVAMAAVWQLYRPVLTSLVPWGKVAKASTAWITIDTAANAKSLARKLVESKLAACVNVVPKVTSIYEWQGKVEEEEEYLLIVKTRADPDWKRSFAEFIERNHPYDLPECIFMDIDGSPNYIDWIRKNTNK